MTRSNRALLCGENWFKFPDPTKKGMLTAPIGPGCYELPCYVRLLCKTSFLCEDLTIFCAEDKMNMVLDERVRHGLCRPFRALILNLPYPPLTRWAQ